MCATFKSKSKMATPGLQEDNDNDTLLGHDDDDGCQQILSQNILLVMDVLESLCLRVIIKYKCLCRLFIF